MTFFVPNIFDHQIALIELACDCGHVIWGLADDEHEPCWACLEDSEPSHDCPLRTVEKEEDHDDT